MDKNHASDSDESDEDYCPDNEKSQVLSECDSESDASSSETETPQPQKRKSRQKRKPKESPERDQSPPPEDELNGEESEENKKHADALWADFLSDTKDSVNSAKSQPETEKEAAPEKSKADEQTPSGTTNEKVKVTEIFEFAGEQVRVTKEVDAAEAAKASLSPASSKKPGPARPPPGRLPVKRPGGGGLGAVLGQINKKNKLTVLEKSKLDWDSFKAKEGLSEELKTHNKGKDGYLERQDFLQRADLRQFEREREMRLNARRSKH